MESRKSYIKVEDLEVYQLSRELSKIAWEIYQILSYEDKKIMGDQFIRSTDSVGANIVEGYHRYHFLDKIRFYYISRASLSESQSHWLELLFEREKINRTSFENYIVLATRLEVKLNNFISATYNQIKNKKNEKP